MCVLNRLIIVFHEHSYGLMIFTVYFCICVNLPLCPFPSWYPSVRAFKPLLCIMNPICTSILLIWFMLFGGVLILMC